MVGNAGCAGQPSMRGERDLCQVRREPLAGEASWRKPRPASRDMGPVKSRQCWLSSSERRSYFWRAVRISGRWSSGRSRPR
jgi:hypothetical protein